MNRAMVLAICLSIAPIAAVNAEQSETFGDYTVHYVAFTTDILTPEVAKAYKIKRSKKRALMNVSVLKKVMGATAQPVRAKVEATASNLSAQLRTLHVREINDHSAIYYIAETPVSNEETLRFSLSVLPEGEPEAFSFSFDQQFYTE